uniref:NADH dehydrogenase subunit 6 n=1 Tax=Macrostomum lignano TaxID=282301 RepID=A0A1Z1LZW0_9PLAT|nr:NADH dehydrogenase subunit 6 [Macrostomum lignano]ARW59243.1 NADH dehydrogenase subunit 6 [Macrostomum lignano]ATA64825.1 NADH dehydrogenase subunit 6 [Macrostomum lignano]
MGEIFFLVVFLNIGFLFFFNSFLYIIGSFFLICLGSSGLVSFYFLGWLGIVLFLVFVGGILVIVFYLGIYGNYYSFSNQFFSLIYLIFFTFPSIFITQNNSFSFGEYSDFYLNFLVFVLISGFLFLVLFSISKMVGYGSSLRSYF